MHLFLYRHFQNGTHIYLRRPRWIYADPPFPKSTRFHPMHICPLLEYISLKNEMNTAISTNIRLHTVKLFLYIHVSIPPPPICLKMYFEVHLFLYRHFQNGTHIYLRRRRWIYADPPFPKSTRFHPIHTNSYLSPPPPPPHTHTHTHTHTQLNIERIGYQDAKWVLP